MSFQGISATINAFFIRALRRLLVMASPSTEKGTPSTDKMAPGQLREAILTVLPELATDEELEDALSRLNLLAMDDYVAAGYYIRDEEGLDIHFLDGERDQMHAINLAEVVVDTVGNVEGMGYFFVCNAFDEPGAYDYAHFFLELDPEHV
jgi:hypothetical protein